MDESQVAGFIDTHPDIGARLLAEALDRKAETLGRGHAGRLVRALATQAHTLWLAIAGAHVLDTPEYLAQPTEGE
ncbi:MAG TPA: hypothetical protein VFE42_20630 [Chloroflexota bacterium]|nr:hypothetical protein [Chloroflexota bacterium]HZS89884.1 hypothetical protein [Chloroflexota bacterium]